MHYNAIGYVPPFTRIEVIDMSSKEAPGSRKNLTESDRQAIVSRYEGGESLKRISIDTEISRPIITAIIRNAGVRIRRGPEAQKIAFARMSPEERMAMTASAHDAVRGKRRSEDFLLKQAQSRQAGGKSASPAEEKIISILESRGIQCSPQLAVGKYNIDIAIGPVAVELFGGGWHAYGRHAARSRNRFRYILDAGYFSLIVWHAMKGIIDDPCFIADEIIATIDEVSRDPSLVGKYRMIRSDGNLVTGVIDNVDYVTLVPSLRNNSGVWSANHR